MTEQEKKKKKTPLYRKFVNVFIGILSGIVIFSLIFLGFSQTYTFREYLKDKIISAVNSSTNGRLNIDRIDGTIITSLFLKNTSLAIGNDTIFSAKNIEIKTSPLQLLLRKIYFRKIELEDVSVQLREYENGEWNFEALSKPSEPDTTIIDAKNDSGEFYFAIQVNELLLHNLNFWAQTNEFANSTNSYKTMETDDLRIENIDLDAALFADIKNNNFNVIIKHLALNPNFDRFKLLDLSGNFEITKNYANIKNFNITTDSSDIDLNVRLDNFNLLGDLDLEKFENYPLEFELNASPFNFDDLSSFIDATEILKGNTEAHIKAKGKFGDFQIEDLFLKYLDTEFKLSGQLKELHRPSNLYIIANIEDSYANYENVNKLLPTLDLPVFPDLKIENFSAAYEGEPTKYQAEISGDVGEGNIKAFCFMDLQVEPMKYNAWFESTKADLYPIIGINTSINASGSIKGTGTNPLDLNTDFKFSALNSKFNGYDIDSMSFQGKANSQIIKLNTSAIINNSYSTVKGEIDYTNPSIPAYNISGTIDGLDLSRFLNNDNVSSNLNFDFNITGEHFDLDTLTGNILFDMRNSIMKNKPVEATHIELTFAGDPSERRIKLESDIVDISIAGKFAINTVLDLLIYEAKIIPEIITDKVAGLNPLYVFDDETAPLTEDLILPDIINTQLMIDYEFEFKDIKLISTFFDLQKFEILGDGKGKISNNSDNFSISTQLDLNYILASYEESTFYVSDFLADFNFSRDNQSLSFDNIFGTVSLSGEKLYAGIEINNIFADLIFNQNKLFINAYAETENTLTSEIEGYLVMSSSEQEIFLNRVLFDYKGVNWENESPINIIFNPDYIDIRTFLVKHNEAELNIEGTIINMGEQDLTLSLTNLPGNILMNYILDTESPLFRANINLNSKITGTFANPLINVDMDVDSLYFGLVNIGHLICNLDYNDKQVATDIIFLDSTNNYKSPNLTLTGTLPIDLSFESVTQRLPEDKEVSLHLLSENFDLSSIGNIIPGISNQTGNLYADVSMSGPYSNLVRTGEFLITDASLRSNDNNLDYLFDLAIRFNEDQLIVDKLNLANSPSSKFPGILFGNGVITFDGLVIDNIDMTLNGNIALLGYSTSAVSPYFYGDLFVETDGDLKFSYKDNKPFVKGSILLVETDLTYISGESAVNFSNSDFIYNILVDSTQFERKELEFQRALYALERAQRSESAFSKNLNAEIDIKILKDAKLQFILSKTANQKLIVEAKGDLKFENIDGISNVQGEINLLPGSKLEFLKTFEAEGSIRFETDITDPYLDIIATYTAGYESANESVANQEVAIKIKLTGPLSELGKNLANNPDNISVYLGSRNIENNIPDRRYDASDAFSFIFVGKFKGDLTTTDKNQVASQTAALNNTAASFLGSVLTGYVNSAIGDVINNIQLSQSGEYTKFSVSGKFQNIRYKFGGTTQIFQDINKANIKLEYLFNSNFLIRLERKNPLFQSFGIDEKINELGLKYRFEF